MERPHPPGGAEPYSAHDPVHRRPSGNGAGQRPSQRQAAAVEGLMRHNAARTSLFVKRRFFQMIDDGTLHDERRRDTYLACVQRISRGFQSIMFTRQAFCRDPRYYAVFLAHLEEEFGHDKLIARRPDSREIKDTVVEAVLAWFAHQMAVLDNVEKTALMHLVLEVAGDHFHSALAPVLGRYVQTGYFETHAELDEDHSAMGVKLLEEQWSASSDERLGAVVDEGWDMMDTMTDRMATLVERCD